MSPTRALAFLVLLSACGEAPAPRPATAASAGVQATPTSLDASVAEPAGPEPAKLAFVGVALPGATAPAAMDYLAFEARRSRVWVPVGGTGSVDVYDTQSGAFRRVDGFATTQRDHGGKLRTLGPSAVSIGEGVAYVGNRASSEVCPVDTESLKMGPCLKLASAPDGVAYVAPTKEVWVTTPRDRAIAVLDATSPPKAKAGIRLEGAPEGYAVDAQRGLFFTNLEDRNKTVAIDIATHAPVATWDLACGDAGPRGVSVDADGRGLVFVACTDHVLILDGLHGGVTLGTLDTGAGVDNIDWLASEHLLYVAAAKTARVTIARVDHEGKATPIAVGTSVEGARNGVVDGSGRAYVADPKNARLLVFSGLPNDAAIPARVAP